MKKILLLISILISLSAGAQTSVYHPFPDSNATWCCYKASAGSNCCHCGSPDFEAFSTYQLAGQTLISGIVYNRLLHYEVSFDHCLPGTFIDTTTYFIRQDTSLKKVWIYDTATNSDTILFDFDLHVGDTLNASREYWARYSFSPNYWIVTSIDSISINGQYRKRFKYEMAGGIPVCSSSMIEGIGSSHGLLYQPPNCFEYYAVVHKFIQNNLVLYGDSSPILSVCHDFMLSINENSEKISATISPNPFYSSATLHIKNFDFVKSELKIFDAMGRLMQQQVITLPSTIVNRRNLAEGLYYYQVTGARGHLTSGKFVIE